jgi:hypothetical protein
MSFQVSRQHTTGNRPIGLARPSMPVLSMRIIICLAGLISLLAMSGCIVREREYRGGSYDEHYRYYGHDHYPYDHDWDHHY